MSDAQQEDSRRVEVSYPGVKVARDVTFVEQNVFSSEQSVAQRFQRIHLAGWCQGAQYAAVAAKRLQEEGALATLVQSLLTHFDLPPEREDAFVPIPLQATDFTLSAGGRDFIRGNPACVSSC